MAVDRLRAAPLHQHSQQVILDNQKAGGGYLACPHMPDYQFSWFRDGAFIAYALTLDGATYPIPHQIGFAAQWDSAGKFHQWCATMINQRAEALERTIARAANGEALVLADTLNARYSDDGMHPAPTIGRNFSSTARRFGCGRWPNTSTCAAPDRFPSTGRMLSTSRRAIWRRSGSRRAMTVGKNAAMLCISARWRRLSPG